MADIGSFSMITQNNTSWSLLSSYLHYESVAFTKSFGMINAKKHRIIQIFLNFLKQNIQSQQVCQMFLLSAEIAEGVRSLSRKDEDKVHF